MFTFLVLMSNLIVDKRAWMRLTHTFLIHSYWRGDKNSGALHWGVNIRQFAMSMSILQCCDFSAWAGAGYFSSWDKVERVCWALTGAELCLPKMTLLMTSTVCAVQHSAVQWRRIKWNNNIWQNMTNVWSFEGDPGDCGDHGVRGGQDGSGDWSGIQSLTEGGY